MVYHAGLDLGRARRRALVYLKHKERDYNMHVIGLPGMGKSSFLFDLVIQDVRRGEGVCVIDPHGTLIEKIVGWCADHMIDEERKVVVVDPSDEQWVVGINPLDYRSRNQTPSTTAEDVLITFGEVWGSKSFDETPQLKRGLRALLNLLIVNHLTLAEARILLGTPSNLRGGGEESSGEALRAYLLQHLDNPALRQEWADFSGLSGGEFQEFFRSTINRVMDFVTKPTVRTMLGDLAAPINFRALMDERAVVLVNLSQGPGFSLEEDGRLMGRLLLNQLVRQGWGRSEAVAKERPFYVYIDECYRYLTDAVAVMLDQMRKFGIFLTAAHQRLSQLEEYGSPFIKNALMSDAQVKVLFRCGAEDATELADKVFRTEIKVGEPDPRYNKPVVVSQVPIWLLSESETESDSVASSSTESESLTRRELDGVMSGEGERLTEGSSSGLSSSSSYAHTSGMHQTLANQYEVMPTRPFGLDEALHVAGNRLINLKAREALVFIPGKRSKKIRTLNEPYVYADAAERGRFRQRVAVSSGYSRPRLVAERDIAFRAQALEVAARAYVRTGGIVPAPQSDDDFWE